MDTKTRVRIDALYNRRGTEIGVCPFCHYFNARWIKTIYLNNGRPYPYSETYEVKLDTCSHFKEHITTGVGSEFEFEG